MFHKNISVNIKPERLTSVLRHCGFRFNIKFVLHQFCFVITGKFSAYLTTTDVKHSNVISNPTGRYRLLITRAKTK
jgi:hypothetical protein